MSRRTPVPELLSEEKVDSSLPVRRSSRISQAPATKTVTTRRSSVNSLIENDVNGEADMGSPAVEKKRTRRASTDEVKSTPIKTRRGSISKIIEDEKRAATPTPNTPSRRSTRIASTSPSKIVDGPARRTTRSASIESVEEKLPVRRSTRRSSVDTQEDVSKEEPIEKSKPVTRRRRSSSIDEPPVENTKPEVKPKTKKLFEEDNKLEPIEEQDNEVRDEPEDSSGKIASSQKTKTSLDLSVIEETEDDAVEDESKKIIKDIDEVLEDPGIVLKQKPSAAKVDSSTRSVFSPVTPKAKPSAKVTEETKEADIETIEITDDNSRESERPVEINASEMEIAPKETSQVKAAPEEKTSPLKRKRGSGEKEEEISDKSPVKEKKVVEQKVSLRRSTRSSPTNLQEDAKKEESVKLNSSETEETVQANVGAGIKKPSTEDNTAAGPQENGQDSSEEIIDVVECDSENIEEANKSLAEEESLKTEEKAAKESKSEESSSPLKKKTDSSKKHKSEDPDTPTQRKVIDIHDKAHMTVGSEDSFTLHLNMSLDKTQFPEEVDGDEVFTSPGSNKENSSINVPSKNISKKKETVSPRKSLSMQDLKKNQEVNVFTSQAKRFSYLEPMEVDEDSICVKELEKTPKKLEAKSKSDTPGRNKEEIIAGAEKKDSSSSVSPKKTVVLMSNEKIEAVKGKDASKEAISVEADENLAEDNTNDEIDLTNDDFEGEKSFHHINSFESDKDKNDSSSSKSMSPLKSAGKSQESVVSTYDKNDDDDNVSTDMSIRLVDDSEIESEDEVIEEEQTVEKKEPLKNGDVIRRSKRPRISDGTSSQILLKLQLEVDKTEVEKCGNNPSDDSGTEPQKSKEDSVHNPEEKKKPEEASTTGEGSSKRRSSTRLSLKKEATTDKALNNPEEAKKSEEVPIAGEGSSKRRSSNRLSLKKSESTENVNDGEKSANQEDSPKKSLKKAQESDEDSNQENSENESMREAQDGGECSKQEKIEGEETEILNKSTSRRSLHGPTEAGETSLETPNANEESASPLKSKMEKMKACGVNFVNPTPSKFKLDAKASAKLDEYLAKKIDALVNEDLENDEDGYQKENDSGDESASEIFGPVNEFLDDLAEEGEEDTPSEGSNDIIDEGESINSTESELDSDESYDLNDSFLVEDDEEPELLSGEEYDLEMDNSKEKYKSKGNTKRRRIIQNEDDSSSDRNSTKVSFSEKVEIIQKAASTPAKEIQIKKKKTSMNKSPKISNQNESSKDVEREEIKEKTRVSSPRKIESTKIPTIKVNLVGDSSSDEDIEVNDSEIKEKSVFEEKLRSLVKAEGTTSTPNKNVAEVANSSSHNNSGRSSSIIIHENVSVNEIQDGLLTEKLQQVVKVFCAGIRSSNGNVSMNVSLDYVENPTTSSATENDDVICVEEKNTSMQEEESSLNKSKQESLRHSVDSNKKRRSSQISPQRIEKWINQSREKSQDEEQIDKNDSKRAEKRRSSSNSTPQRIENRLNQTRDEDDSGLEEVEEVNTSKKKRRSSNKMQKRLSLSRNNEESEENNRSNMLDLEYLEENKEQGSARKKRRSSNKMQKRLSLSKNDEEDSEHMGTKSKQTENLDSEEVEENNSMRKKRRSSNKMQRLLSVTDNDDEDHNEVVEEDSHFTIEMNDKRNSERTEYITNKDKEEAQNSNDNEKDIEIEVNNKKVETKTKKRNKKRRHEEEVQVEALVNKRKKLLEMQCEELAADDLRHLLPSRKESDNTETKVKTKKLKRLQANLKKETKSTLFKNLVTDVKNRPRRLLKPSIGAGDDSWNVEEFLTKPSLANIAKCSFDFKKLNKQERKLDKPSVSNEMKCNFNSDKFDSKDFKNQMLYDPRIKRENTSNVLRKKGFLKC